MNESGIIWSISNNVKVVPLSEMKDPLFQRLCAFRLVGLSSNHTTYTPTTGPG